MRDYLLLISVSRTCGPSHPSSVRNYPAGSHLPRKPTGATIACLPRIFILCALLSICLSGQTLAPYSPLTASQRWDYYLSESLLSPGLYLAALGAAGGAQLDKDPPEWGQGIDGYARRAGSLLATFAIHTTVYQASDAALRYDPRYLHCDCKGGRRLAHAFVWSFLTKNDEGKTRFNFPVFAGAYASGMIPFLWFPDRYSPLKDGFREGSQQLGFTVGINVVREFSPELKRFFRLRP